MHMKRALLVLALLTIMAAPVAGQVFFADEFDLPDGSFPAEWTWTGDPRGGGEFEVHGGTFVHTDGGHVHYFRPDPVVGIGLYEFEVLDTNWVFGWLISPADPMAGRCLCFYHNDAWGQWGYSFTEFSWWTLDPGTYPDGQYMWHNGTDLRIVHSWTPGPLEGWHSVSILTGTDFVEIRVDQGLIFSEAYESIPDGYVGLGCDAPGTMTPAFDNVAMVWPDPVEARSWSSIKSLFR
jgi:hypothetical protein